jgi:hypothetical protein
MAALKVMELPVPMRHSEAPRFHERGEESRVEVQWCRARDPSLRLKTGFAQDDADCKFELSHYRRAH